MVKDKSSIKVQKNALSKISFWEKTRSHIQGRAHSQLERELHFESFSVNGENYRPRSLLRLSEQSKTIHKPIPKHLLL